MYIITLQYFQESFIFLVHVDTSVISGLLEGRVPRSKGGDGRGASEWVCKGKGLVNISWSNNLLHLLTGYTDHIGCEIECP